MKKYINWIIFMLTGKCDKAVNAKIVDYSGQGRDRYGL